MREIINSGMLQGLRKTRSNQTSNTYKKRNNKDEGRNYWNGNKMYSKINGEQRAGSPKCLS